MKSRFLRPAVSLVLVGVLLWRIPIGDISVNFLTMDVVRFACALALAIFAWWLSAVRLWFLAPDYPLSVIVRMTFVSVYYATVLPGQVAGDAVKAFRLSRTQTSSGQAVAVTVVDRAIATLTLFILGSCVIPWVPEVPRTLALLLPLASVFTVLGLGLLANRSINRLLVQRLRSAHQNRVRVAVIRLLDGILAVLTEPFRLFMCLILALAFHALCVGIHLVLGPGLGIRIPAVAWVLTYAGVSLITLLPITIGGIGLREGGYVGILSIFAVPASIGLSFSIAIFSCTLVGALLGWIAEVTEKHQHR